jgi:hypothetical protein
LTLKVWNDLAFILGRFLICLSNLRSVRTFL